MEELTVITQTRSTCATQIGKFLFNNKEFFSKNFVLKYVKTTPENEAQVKSRYKIKAVPAMLYAGKCFVGESNIMNVLAVLVRDSVEEDEPASHGDFMNKEFENWVKAGKPADTETKLDKENVEKKWSNATQKKQQTIAAIKPRKHTAFNNDDNESNTDDIMEYHGHILDTYSESDYEKNAHYDFLAENMSGGGF